MEHSLKLASDCVYPGSVGRTIDTSMYGFGTARLRLDGAMKFVHRSSIDDAIGGGRLVIVISAADVMYVLTHKCVTWNATRISLT